MSSGEVYYTLIVRGERTINDVPSKYRQEVINLLVENGYEKLIESDCILR